MPYRHLEDITIADVAFEIIGNDLNELFADAALATFSEMVDIHAVGSSETREIELEAENLDDLLFKWLEHLIYLKDAESVWFGKFDVNIEKKNINYKLKASAYGEQISPGPKKMRTDVKAITRHMFKIEYLEKAWKATFVLDI